MASHLMRRDAIFITLKKAYGKITGQFGAVAPLLSVQTMRFCNTGVIGELAVTCSAKTDSMISRETDRLKKLG
jgi:hypothetical protein